MNRTRRFAQRLHNTRQVCCEVCCWEGSSFEAVATFGYLRWNTRCPNCDSLERHRDMLGFLVREG
jgi:hypothetical protein